MTMRMAFGPLDIEYDEHVLEPRLWTLAQARWAAELLRSHGGVSPLLELCAGAGQIGLAAAALSDRAAVLVDASEDACRCGAVRPRRSAARADGGGGRARRVVRAGIGRPAVHPFRSHPRLPPRPTHRDRRRRRRPRAGADVPADRRQPPAPRWSDAASAPGRPAGRPARG